MKIVIVHLTRMQEGFICAAGIDLETGKHVRPVLGRGKRCKINMLASFGGPFDIAQVVEFSRIKPAGKPPEVEDYLFEPKDAKIFGSIGAVEFWKRLERTAKPELYEIFGKDLTRQETKSAIVEPRKGEASLGCLIPASPLKMYMRRGKEDKLLIRMKLNDGAFDVDVSVTDMRLYNSDYTPNTKLVKKLERRLGNCVGVILGVGLTRAYSKGKGFKPVHYLQVNNIHLVENPIWRLK